jgi:hypothetical protein
MRGLQVSGAESMLGPPGIPWSAWQRADKQGRLCLGKADHIWFFSFKKGIKV